MGPPPDEHCIKMSRNLDALGTDHYLVPQGPQGIDVLFVVFKLLKIHNGVTGIKHDGGHGWSCPGSPVRVVPAWPHRPADRLPVAHDQGLKLSTGNTAVTPQIGVDSPYGR